MMGRQGEFTKANFGYSVPVDAPLYQPFPVYYEDSTFLTFPYVTSADAAAKLLPAQFELTPGPDGDAGKLAYAKVLFAKYGFSTYGAYNEVAQVIQARYRGKVPDGVSADVGFAVRLHVDSDMALAGGREIGGFPKKMGHINIQESPLFLGTLESPKGLRICSGEMNAFAKVAEQQQLPPAMQKTVLPYASLRVIPNPDLTAPYQPSLCQIIYTEWVLSEGTFWSGRGALSFTGASALSPYHTLPIIQQLPPMTPTNPVGTMMYRGKMSISRVAVLENF
jgi:acetoacetate decarboxylase